MLSIVRLVAFAAAGALLLPAQPPDPRKEVADYLDRIAFRHLDARARDVAAVQTRADAEKRQAAVRATVLKLLNGVPDHHGPVAVRTFGSIAADGFRIEKIAYESLPGLWVTADVYVPTAATAPFPAVLVTPGHGATSKAGEYNWGANLAHNGILALAVDPMGQGERLQHYDPELEESKVGQGTPEHGHAAFSTLLIGDPVARYFVNDGMRAVDYLTSRKDVNPDRIGAFGCSGGGTATAYLAALDPRIKVAATACYITSYQELLNSIGNQEAEQSIPGFLTANLDFADWVELAAPKPYVIVSTTEDMFPFAGARQTVDEARHFYDLLGAADRIQWITGPGRHGNLLPIGAQIVGFLVKWLKDGATAEYREFRLERPEELQCTPTGQVSTSFQAESIESINRKHAQSVMPAHPDVSSQTIRAAAAISAEPGPPPAVTVVKTEPRGSYRVDTVAMRMEPDVEAPAIAAIPSAGGRKPAVILMDSQPKERLAAAADFDRPASGGRVVLILQPRGTPLSPSMARSSLLGPFNILSLRAMLVSKTLVGLRADDAIRAVNWLSSLPDVDPASITLYGNGPLGVVALHAAAVDRRILRVVIENTLASYRMALDAPLHRDLAGIVVPGALRHYDLPDLVRAIAPRTVAIWNAVDAMGKPVPGSKQRTLRDPLPID